MKIIDTHVHLSHIQSFKEKAKQSRVSYALRGLQKEMKDNDIALSIGMGLREIEGGEGFPDERPITPMGLDMLSQSEKNIVQCVGINPYRLGTSELHQLEKALLHSHVVGMNIYLGDYPFYAYDNVYEPVYELAKAYQVPVVFHTGLTYTKGGRLKYAHPLTLDEVAMKHREVTFIMSQCGAPWLLDAVAIMGKNDNVLANVSSFASGSPEKVKERMNSRDYMSFLKQNIAVLGCDKKFMFGTNWPFVQIKPYIQFVKELFPVSAWDDVFYKTATEVFSKIKNIV